MKVFKLTLSFLAFLILTGCGSIMGPGGLVAPAQSRWSSASDSTSAGGPNTNTNTTGNSAYSCPNSPNVLPRNFAGTDGNFTVCKSTQNPTTQLLVKGSSTKYFDNSEICLFLGQKNSASSALSWVREASTSQPLYRCGTLSDNQVQISMPALPSSLTWNTTVIIDSSDIHQMINCIYYGTASLCPRYSLGTLQ